MSGDAGLVLMILGIVALVSAMTERVASYRRCLGQSVETLLDPALREAFPPPPIARDLQRLAVEAEAVLESNELCRQGRHWRRRLH